MASVLHPETAPTYSDIGIQHIDERVLRVRRYVDLRSVLDEVVVLQCRQFLLFLLFGRFAVDS